MNGCSSAASIRWVRTEKLTSDLAIVAESGAAASWAHEAGKHGALSRHRGRRRACHIRAGRAVSRDDARPGGDWAAPSQGGENADIEDVLRFGWNCSHGWLPGRSTAADSSKSRPSRDVDRLAASSDPGYSRE